MFRADMLRVRKTVWDEYEERKRLGEFDANSKTHLIELHALLEVINHILEEMKRLGI